MKTRILAVFLGALFVTGAAAQSSDKYTVNKEWAQIPADLPWNQSTSWISPDGKGNVVVLVRAAPYFRVFTREGKFVKAWGDAGLFQTAHGLSFDREGFIWATDNAGHAVYKFSPDGKLLMTLGKRGVAGDDASRDLFNQPSAVFIAANGDIFVADGYVNSRLVESISGLGRPHGIGLDADGALYAADSMNRVVMKITPKK